MHPTFFARQPIYDRDLKITAYELLYRGLSGEDASHIEDGDAASSQMLMTTFSTLHDEAVIDDKHIYINLTHNLLLNMPKIGLPTEKVVLEILEDITPSKELIKAIKHLKYEGYQIALDDFEYEENRRPLMELADIIKYDLFVLDKLKLDRQLARIEPYDVKLLAEKVETHEVQQHCMDLGFDYFQGYFLCRPKSMQSKRLPVNRALMVKLLAQLQQKNVSLADISQLITQDPLLSFKIMRLFSSAASPLSQKISTVEEAVKILGLDHIRNWCNIILLSNLDDKPHALLITSLVRAKMCEQLFEFGQLDNPASGFTLGLFSTLDAMLDLPMVDIINKMSLSDEVRAALTDHSGLLGELLKAVVAYEQGHWDSVSFRGLSNKDFYQAYIRSLTWVKDTGSVLK